MPPTGSATCTAGTSQNSWPILPPARATRARSPRLDSLRWAPRPATIPLERASARLLSSLSRDSVKSGCGKRGILSVSRVDTIASTTASFGSESCQRSTSGCTRDGATGFGSLTFLASGRALKRSRTRDTSKRSGLPPSHSSMKIVSSSSSTSESGTVFVDVSSGTDCARALVQSGASASAAHSHADLLQDFHGLISTLLHVRLRIQVGRESLRDLPFRNLV